jgi:hypothetical protein
MFRSIFCIRTPWLSILLLGLSYQSSLAQPFFSQKKEVLYRIHYGFIDAGELLCFSDTNYHFVENKKCRKMEIIGKTTGAAAAFASIHDRWISYVDSATGYPFRFIRELQENNYAKEELTEFDRENQIVIVSTKTDKDEYTAASFKVPQDAHDMVSAYLALNAYPLHTLAEDSLFGFHVFLEDSTYFLQIRFLGKETIKTKYGKIEAFKISPIMPDNSVFSKEEAILCWISADAERIPLRLRAKLAVGAIEMELEHYSAYEH